MRLAPPLVFSKTQADSVLEVFDQALVEVTS
jgi:4-aminobutyrate aminotransferase-like enzyme